MRYFEKLYPLAHIFLFSSMLSAAGGLGLPWVWTRRLEAKTTKAKVIACLLMEASSSNLVGSQKCTVLKGTQTTITFDSELRTISQHHVPHVLHFEYIEPSDSLVHRWDKPTELGRNLVTGRGTDHPSQLDPGAPFSQHARPMLRHPTKIIKDL